MSPDASSLLFACGVAEESSECLGYLARSSSAALITCAMIFLAELQACKSGDMACVRGPLGHFIDSTELFAGQSLFSMEISVSSL